MSVFSEFTGVGADEFTLFPAQRKAKIRAEPLLMKANQRV
jgi:hypothetical protein